MGFTAITFFVSFPFTQVMVLLVGLPPHPLLVPAGIALCEIEINFEEKSQANQTFIVVETAPVRGEGRVLLPTLSVQVAVPNHPVPI